MAESSATIRASSSGAEEFERRMRSLDQPAAESDDPLAELARLVGQEDPFRNATPAGRSNGSAAPVYRGVERRYSSDRGDASLPDRADDFAGEYDAGASSGAPDDPAIVHATIEPPVFAPRAETGYVRREPRPVETSADAWARGLDESMASSADSGALTATRDEVAREGSGSPPPPRTLIVLAAVVLLTGGGLAASFFAKPSRAVSPAAASTPTILADTGPSKVQPEAPSTDANAPTEPSTLLDKNKSDGTATAKVVDSVEQPVDLAQAVKPAANPPAASQPTVDAEPAPSSSPFPEPKKVKTILVRPDGSVIPERPASAASDPATGGIPQTANLAFDPRTSLHLGPAAQASAAETAAAPASTPDEPPPAVADPTPAVTPKPAKTLTRIATTPKQPAATPSTPKVKPPAARPKPVAEADATPTADTPADAPAAASTGAFAVQLGAPSSEAEATAVSNRLVKKFADQLGGTRPAIHKADAAGKTVYRIRVGNLSQDDAKALCSKLQAAGGGCFVARN